MPFLGLIDTQGHEVRGEGYHRIDMSEIRFKISPPRNVTSHFEFVNTSAILWSYSQNQWPTVSGVGIYNEVDDKRPLIIRTFLSSPMHVPVGDTIIMAPGQLTMDHLVTPNERRNAPLNEKRSKSRCPKCGAMMETKE
jgi:hypothetical protein